MAEQVITGNKAEQKLFTECLRHYSIASEDLDVRKIDFDKKDILFRSHIEEGSWPYNSLVFDPRIFTVLYEKTARILANKPKGRLVPREGGDSLGAKINNELLSWQWDDNERAGGESMLSKWSLMDLNARKYGASFALTKWNYHRKVDNETKKSYPYFDGPDFKPLNNRDCLPNPSYSTIKNWFQHRDYPTIQEMSEVNDAARSKPIYKNLDLLKRAIQNENKERGGDTRDYVIKNKSIKGLVDYLGKDEYYKNVEVVTEYRCDRWISFAPKHGIILRDIPNPNKHGQIPVVMLKYYAIDDDLYGLSEIEPVEKIQKAINAILCQYLDAINMSLYTPLKIRSTGGAVQMHTINFGPGQKWLMNDPSSDVISHDQSTSGVQEFTSTYRFLVGALQEALGETSASTSNLNPGQEGKTATEVKDLATSRSARDNYNQIFLGEALKKQMIFWFQMNQQFLFSNPQEQHKIIRIVGKDAIKYFQNAGLDGEGLTEDATDLLSNEDAPMDTNLQDFMQPMYPVSAGGLTVPKMTMEDDGQVGTLIVEPEDLSGNYDYIPDIESMRIPDEAQMINAKKNMVEIALNPQVFQQLAQEGYKLKSKEVLEDYFEQLGMKDADKYFEKIQQPLPVQLDANGQPIQTQPTGEAGLNGGGMGQVNGQLGGVPQGAQALPVG